MPLRIALVCAHSELAGLDWRGWGGMARSYFKMNQPVIGFDWTGGREEGRVIRGEGEPKSFSKVRILCRGTNV